MTGEPRLLAAALAAAGRGWPVLPLQPYGKRPAITGWPQAATCDPGVLAGWWKRAPYNVGISCGPAGLLVVDLDQPRTFGVQRPDEWAGVGVRDGRDVFAVLAGRAAVADPVGTYTVATPRGEHRYFAVAITLAGDRPVVAQVGRNTAGALGWLVDTRAAGGYVVAAGSTRWLAGRRVHYRQTGPVDVMAAPDWLLDALAPRLPVHRVVLTRWPEAYARAAVAGEVAAVRAAAPGTRNSCLFGAAFRLGQLAAAGLLDRVHVTDELLSAAAVHIGVDGFTPAEAERAVANGLRYGSQRPRPFDGSGAPMAHGQ